MKPLDQRAVAKQVYDFAASQAPLAPLVKEALGVIDDALDSFGCVPTLGSPYLIAHWPVIGRTMFLSASTVARTVSTLLELCRG